MNTLATPMTVTDYREYALWLIALLAVAFGFRHFRELAGFVLDQLYRVFIQDNPVA